MEQSRRIVIGMQVKVVSGPLKGRTGKVFTTYADGRVEIQVSRGDGSADHLYIVQGSDVQVV